MKLLFASDLHGSAYYAEKLVEIYHREQPDKLILLGDLLYHGPRNDLPRDYAPKRVIPLLNALKENLLAVRGNCDAEVDQMVLEFACMADYATLWADGHTLFITHGHLFDEEHLPALQKGDVFMHGHTHLHEAADRGAYYFCNPGSLALPKGDGKHTYLLYEDGVFTMREIDGGALETLRLL